MNTSASPRATTRVDELADSYFDSAVELSPIEATSLGVPGQDEMLDDFSPEGYERISELRRTTLSALRTVTAEDDVDEVTIAAMTERLELAEEIHEAGYDLADLNVIASPLQNVRDVFDLMPTDTDEDWAVIATRMRAVPEALTGWLQSLRVAADAGNRPARRQVERCIEQCADHISPEGYFHALTQQAVDGTEDEALADELRHAIDEAARAYEETAEKLREEVLVDAREADAVGAERYALHSRQFLGARIDLEETYRWGQEELARITAEMKEVAERVAPGAGVKGAIAALDESAAYTLHGTDALQEWMQQKADEAVTALADTHFDVPDPVRRIECMIAPTNSGGIYYTGPSVDFSRPGRMWWAVPRDVEKFGTWRELTTVYHEGVPGHHLQIGQTMYRSGLLNRWRRLGAWTSGHGEGWALYAERLMAELGYLDDDGNRLGMLDGQSLRAARVVLDIGVHCGFEAPAEVGGGEWTYDKAWSFLSAHADMAEGFLRFELDRYLGWPGQAPSYKVGERLWFDLREKTREREGADFDLRAFHRRALDVGSVGLDVLRDALLPPT
ncbi:DUF885 domain-containing protein [Dermacoccus sp. Tok2021]|uniref:DUF885 domain-containing protein n=1 Tax=Dermacoccus sp. Tok2021 TaxID=2826873 RepID=UPI001CA731F8|nr:DUF885 domain-containing protein [Dermacoccus sp. Tok2021]MBZ4496741.1 DUF885 domain-containing protein [Dermacoccus sp. Tok2021]